MSSSSSKCVLAIDLGSSGPKISIVDENGDILATRSGIFKTFYSENGTAVEQDTEDWWKQILALSKEVIDESGTAERIVAIGNSAQYFSSIPVDKEGNGTRKSSIALYIPPGALTTTYGQNYEQMKKPLSANIVALNQVAEQLYKRWLSTLSL